MNFININLSNKKYNYFNNSSNNSKKDKKDKFNNNINKIVIQNKLLYNDIIKSKNDLFNKSIKYISILQKNLMKYNIENYISGGYAFNLYMDKSIINNTNNNILLTNDCDLILLFDLKKKSFNQTIINNIKYIIKSALIYFKNKKQGILKLFLLMNYNNKEEFKNLLKKMYVLGYQLILYKPNLNNNIYLFNFIKIVDKNFFIKIEIKFLNIDFFINRSIYSYGVLNFYNYKIVNNKLEIYENYIPIELLILNKNEVNIEIMQGSIIKNGYKLYVYNLKFMIYNYMNLYYDYNYKKLNKKIINKTERGYMERDLKRLYYLIKIYYYNKYKNTDKNKHTKTDKKTNKEKLESILQNFKLNIYKFKKYMFNVDVNNIDFIDNLINNS